MYLLGQDVQRSNDYALWEVEAERRWTYTELTQSVREHVAILRRESAKRLIFILCQNDVATVIRYLSAIEAGHATVLLDGSLREELLRALLERYRPELVWGCKGELAGYEPGDAGDVSNVWYLPEVRYEPPHRDLALLLSTSGSTGSPKLVRLTRGAVEHNARAIGTALGITPTERPVTSLPLHYSYGLSVLNSHLAAGAEVVLSGESVITEGFWSTVQRCQCTSFAGVPYQYEMLRRLDLNRLVPDSLTTMTQAGGRLSPQLIEKYSEFMVGNGGQFFVMYGQTEATARITVLPPSCLPQKLDSAGYPLVDGSLSIEVDGESRDEPNQIGEVVYRGPNVMLGYAEGREDLARGDDLEGVLRTGDMGYLDDEGALFITGRSKRIAKVFGLRLNLDEVEALVRAHGPAAVVEGDNRLVVWVEFANDDQYAQVTRELSEQLGIHFSGIAFRFMEKLPVNANGKVDYQVLSQGTI